MDVRNLRQILAIREHGSFAKAAEVLGISQPSLSKAIARLEDELRVSLFHRTASGSELTPVGQLVADRAGRLIAETNDLIRDTALLAREEGGLLRIGVGTPLRNSFLPRLLIQIAHHHPKLRIHVEVSAADRMLPDLKSRELDIAFCARRGDVIGGDYAFQEFLGTPIVCAARPSHPLAGRAAIPRADVLQFPTCGVRSNYYGNQQLLAAPDDDPNAGAYTTTDFESFVPLVAATDTILVAPAFMTHPFIRAGTLVRLDVAELITVVYVAATLPVAAFAPLLRQITKYAVSIGEEMEAECRTSQS